MDNIFWTGYSNDERHAIINQINSVISMHGHVVDFMLFSDISLTMKIEIEEFKVDKLYDELNDNLNIDRFEYLNSVSTKERTIYLNITFNKGTGNLIVEVPAVPG
jgi:phosphate uptake regulator